MDKSVDLWAIEKALGTEGFGLICGVDEAGRGPLAGPVFAAAVILPQGAHIPGLNDSKKLSAKKREKLFGEITGIAISFAVASADHNEIDRLNILGATYLAMNRAMGALKIKFDIALIDGNRNTGIEYSSRCVIGGDGRSASIAAASILAKVSRDEFMVKMSEKYPQYGFEKHKGYGTKLHYEKLREYGPCQIHRKSFLKRYH